MSRPRLSWDRFAAVWRLVLGTAILGYGVIVTARVAPSVLPFVLVTGAGLVGLSLSLPWERHRDDDDT